MDEAPRVSIGLPVYNGQSSLPAAIDALLGQSYRDFELIISDNASTDSTEAICRRYAEQDPRITYVRQQHNFGMTANHNYVVGVARGEFFKWASHDDLYARDFLKSCVAALDEHPEASLAHSWCVLMNERGTPIRLLSYPTKTASPWPSHRFRSMLFDGKGDWSYALIRTDILRRTPLLGSYYGADVTLITELSLHGPLHQIREGMYFRRDHPNRHQSARAWSAVFDPRRANRLRHPTVRLYGEYVWGFASAIWRSPLSLAEKRRCYGELARWLVSRAAPTPRYGEERESFTTQPLLYVLRWFSGLVLRTRGEGPAEGSPTGPPDIQVEAVVPGMENKSR